MPRQPDPGLEQRILDAASRLWARGGEKSLTMRAVAKAAGTTTPTVYERYRDRDDILRAIRLQTRRELFAALTRTRTLRQAVRRQIDFALEHSFAYEVLFDGVGEPPSSHEPWPSFNLIRERVAERLGGNPRKYTRLMLSLWSLMHGTAMLIIRGRFEGALRTQTIHACLDALDSILRSAARPGGIARSGPKWPANLILGEGGKSRLGNGNGDRSKGRLKASKQR
ncbi:MAG TPA: TetR/AcrR family transcriptional regulator [Candidatus Sulfotelmatobacter sp.]|nr:TetR/AcrR family transcriptional regulator [Candidatus Sulfotelmatobacter sp.]